MPHRIAAVSLAALTLLAGGRAFAQADSAISLNVWVSPGEGGGPGTGLPPWSPPPSVTGPDPLLTDLLEDFKKNPRFLPGVSAAGGLLNLEISTPLPKLPNDIPAPPSNAEGAAIGARLSTSLISDARADHAPMCIKDSHDRGAAKSIPQPHEAPPDLRPTSTSGTVDARHLNLNLATGAKQNGADPVDPATGEFVHAAVDAEVAGVGLPFVFRRTYRSRWVYDGPCGWGWTHNFDQRLVLDVDRDGLRTAEWIAGDGTITRFVDVGLGWRAEPESRYSLVEKDYGHWTITAPDGLVLGFDTVQDATVLTSMTDLNANTIRIGWLWLTSTTKTLSVPRVDHVIDTLGRVIAFAYRADGYLDHITIPGLGTSSYTYDAHGDLRTATSVAGVTESYAYDPPVPADPSFVPTREIEGECRVACALDEPSQGGASDCINVAISEQLSCNDECRADCAARCPSACASGCQATPAYGQCASVCDSGCQSQCPDLAVFGCTGASRGDDPLFGRKAGEAYKVCQRKCQDTCGKACENHLVCKHYGAMVSIGTGSGGCGANESGDSCGSRAAGYGQIWNDNLCTTWLGCQSAGATSAAQGENGNISTNGTCLPLVGGSNWCCHTECWDCCAAGNCPDELNTCGRHDCMTDCLDVFLNGYGARDPGCQYGSGTGCIQRVTDDCNGNCSSRCGTGCSSDCVAGCAPACQHACMADPECTNRCDHDYVSPCKQGCFETCTKTLAHASGRTTYGRPADAGHNLTSITNGEGILYVQNVYEPSIFSPNFDRVTQQTFGDDVITYNHHDLAAAGPERSSEDAPFLGAAAERVEICPKTCTDLAVGRPARERWIGVGSGGYLVFREPMPPELELESWPVTVPAAFEAYRWFEIQSAGESRKLVPPAPTSAFGLVIETPQGSVTARTDGTGLLTFNGLAPAVLAELLAPRDRVALTIVKTAQGWRAHRGRALGAVEIVPAQACGQEVVVTPGDGGAVQVDSTCAGAFTVRELGRRPGESITWSSPLASPWGDRTWAVDARGRGQPVTSSPRGDPWGAGFGPGSVCPGVQPIPPEPGCLDAAIAFDGASGLMPRPDCHAPWWTRSVGLLVDPDKLDAAAVAAACLPGRLPAPSVPPECLNESYAAPAANASAVVQPITDATVVRDGAGLVWTYYSGKDGRIYRIVNNSSGARLERNYTPDGRLLGELRPFGDRQCLTYDDRQQPVEDAELPAPVRAEVVATTPMGGSAWRGLPREPPPIRHRRSYGLFGRVEVVYDENASALVPLVNTRHDAHGNLVRIEVPALGLTTTATVDARGRPKRITHPDGTALTLDYDPVSGQWHHETRDADGPSPQIRTAERDALGRIRSITAPGAPSQAWTWRPDNQPATETLQLDRALPPTTTTFEYDRAGALHTIIGPEVTQTLVRNKRGLLESTTAQPVTPGAEPRKACFGYDGRGLAVETVDPEGRRVHYQRDTNGLITQVVRGLWGSSASAWDDACDGNLNDGAAFGQEVFETTVRNDRAGGIVLSRTEGSDAIANAWREAYRYDGFGRPIETKLLDGTLYRTGYDARGHVRWRAAYRPGAPEYLDALGASTTLPDASVATLASLTTMDFDALGRPIDIGRLWFADDERGRRQFQGPNQGWLHETTTYLDASSAVEITTVDGGLTHTDFDGLGRAVFTRLPDGRTTVTRQWSNAGHLLTQITEPAATRTGRLVESFDRTDFGEFAEARDAAGGILWHRDFDAFGRPTKHLEPSRSEVIQYTPFGEVDSIALDRAGGTREPLIAYGYRRDGQQKRVRDGLGHETTTTFDFAGRPSVETYPDGTTTHRTYRLGTSALATRIDRNQDTTSIDWDVFHQPRTISGARATAAPGWEGTTTLTFERDVIGLRQAVALNRPRDPSDDVVLTLHQDSLGATVGEGSSLWDREIRYARDVPGRKQTLTFGADVLGHTFDPLGRLAAIEWQGRTVAQYGFLGAGLADHVTWASGLVEHRDFDERGRIQHAAGTVGSTPVYAHTLFYLGNDLVRVDQTLGAATNGDRRSDLFRPDDTGRLVAAGHDAVNLSTLGPRTLADLDAAIALAPRTEHYQIDGAENWTSAVLDGVTVTPTPGPDLRYTDFGGPVSADAEGNATALPDGTKIGFDGLGRVVQATDKHDQSHHFTWDALGQLATHDGPEGRTVFQYAGGRLLAEARGGERILHVPGRGLAPAAVVRGDVVTFNHAAYGERLALATDAHGHVIERYGSSAYGTPTFFDLRAQATPDATMATSVAGNRLFLAGAPYFEDLGLYAMGARWYRPAWGRFITPDPIGYAAGPNRFAYVSNRPNAFVDPTGLWQQQAMDGLLDLFLTSSAFVQGAKEGALPLPEVGVDYGHPAAHALGKIGGGLVGMVVDAGGTMGGAVLVTGGMASCGPTACAGAPLIATGSALAVASVGMGGVHSGRVSEGAAELWDSAGARSESVETRGANQKYTTEHPLSSPVEELPPANAAAEEAFADLAQFRADLGVRNGEGTLARLDVNGQSFYGISAHGQEINFKVNAITRQHAEADAFQQAANAGMRGGRGSLFVDRPLCDSCGMFGGVRSLVRGLGLEALEVVTPSGTMIVRP